MVPVADKTYCLPVKHHILPPPSLIPTFCLSLSLSAARRPAEFMGARVLLILAHKPHELKPEIHLHQTD